MKENTTENLADDLNTFNTTYWTTFYSFDVCKIMNDQFLEDYLLIFVSLTLTGMIYFWNAFKCNRNHEYFCEFSKLRVKNCNSISSVDSLSKSTSSVDSQKSEKIDSFAAFCSFICRALNLRQLKKFTIFGFRCTCGIEFPIPMNPFSKRNRFITGIIYAAYTYNILKIFEYLVIGDQNLQLIDQGKNFIKNKNFSNLNLTIPSNVSLSQINKNFINSFQNATETFTKFAERGILMDLLKQICNVFIIGLRYYPVLLCTELKRKSKFCYLICTLYVIFLLIYYVYMNTFCLLSVQTTIKDAFKPLEQQFQSISNINIKYNPSGPRGLRMNQSKISVHTTLSPNKTRFLRQLDALNKSENYLSEKRKNLTNELLYINDSQFYNNFMYEKFLFYAVLCLITFNMITEFTILMVKSMRIKRIKKERQKKRCHCCQKKLEAENSQTSEEETETVEDVNSNWKVHHELKYTKELLKGSSRKPKSFMKYLFENYIYQNRKDFRYSKQFINTNIIAFILIYYITCIIIRKSKLIVSLSSNLLILLINFLFKMSSASENGFMFSSKFQLNNLIQALYDNISFYIIVACCFTTSIYVIQLFLGIRNYHKHVLNGYRGVYEDIPSPKGFSNAKLASSSLHYRFVEITLHKKIFQFKYLNSFGIFKKTRSIKFKFFLQNINRNIF